MNTQKAHRYSGALFYCGNGRNSANWGGCYNGFFFNIRIINVFKMARELLKVL